MVVDNRKEARDRDRDTERDETRDAERDETRDAERDETRDTARELEPEEKRRDARDGGRDGRGARSPGAHDDVPLICAMAERCRELIRAWDGPTSDQPVSLRLEHLEWMCNRVEGQSEAWESTKLHRWIGFIQAGMIANGVLRLEDARRIFDDAKKAYPHLDQDFLDHLDPDDEFEFDIGGQG